MARPSWSIRGWLGALVAAVALPLLLLLTWIYVSEVQRELTEARDAALRIARATAAQIRELHEDAAALLQRMAARPDLRDFDGTSCQPLFSVVDFNPQDECLYFFDTGGRLLCRSASSDAGSPVAAAAQAWLQGEIRAGRLQPNRPMMRIVSHRLVSVLSIPVVDSRGNPRGIIALLQLPELIGVEQLPPNSVITVLDADGTIMARSADPESWSGRNVRDNVLAGAALRQKEGRTAAIGLDGVSRQYGFTEIPEVGWHVYAGIPTEAVMKPVRRLVVQGIAGGLAIVVLVIAVAIFVARRIEKPIGALARATSSIAEGNHPTVSAEGPREIALLAQTFNEMVDRRSESERNLKALSERLLVVQEQERMRVAREIHDDLGQALTALKMDVIGLVERSPPRPELAPMVDRIGLTLENAVTAVQRISSELRPSVLDDLGLFAAIEYEAQMFEERTGIECELSIPENPPAVGKAAATAIYRMVQEALTNVARHSNAWRVELRVRERSGQLLVEVRDDGRGITAEELGHPSSLGLAGIRERAEILGGTTRFKGVAGRGTIVSIILPLASIARIDA